MIHFWFENILAMIMNGNEFLPFWVFILGLSFRIAFLSEVKNQLLTAFAFSKQLSVRKLGNIAMLGLSFQLSRMLKKPIIWGQPTTLSIEPTTSCNLRCPECPSGLRSFSRPTGMLENGLFEKVILQSKKHLTWLHLYFQGEPFLNPRFLEMVSFWTCLIFLARF